MQYVLPALRSDISFRAQVELTTLKDAFGKDLRGIRPYS